jgi:hypothetical protein
MKRVWMGNAVKFFRIDFNRRVRKPVYQWPLRTYIHMYVGWYMSVPIASGKFSSLLNFHYLRRFQVWNGMQYESGNRCLNFKFYALNEDLVDIDIW